MINILFLCTGNSARSVLGEALLNHLGEGQFHGYSAGSNPAGKVQPLALEVLASNGIAINGLASKSWEVFMRPDDATMQVVLTLCDDAASKPCPVWLDNGVRCHWGLPDPAAVSGEEPARRAAFDYALKQLNTRLTALLALDSELFADSQQHPQLQTELSRIHHQALLNESRKHG